MEKIDRTLLDMKYARIIELISEKLHISLSEAMDKFYNSAIFELIDTNVGDLYCRSDKYLADEICRDNV